MVTRADLLRVQRAQKLFEAALVRMEYGDLLDAALPKPREVAPAPVRAPDPGGAHLDVPLPPHFLGVVPLAPEPVKPAPVGRESPSAAAAKMRRARVRWVPRVLPEHQRSDWEVVDGVPTIVINPRFPFYRESKGDVWYVFETGVLELTRRLRGDELTVSEYYTEVNQILQNASEVRAPVEDGGLGAAGEVLVAAS
jgi:hypothetical protein